MTRAGLSTATRAPVIGAFVSAPVTVPVIDTVTVTGAGADVTVPRVMVAFTCCDWLFAGTPDVLSVRVQLGTVKTVPVVDVIDAPPAHGQGLGLFKVTVWGKEPHDYVRVYEIQAKNDTLAAQEGIRRFVEEMEKLPAEGN